MPPITSTLPGRNGPKPDSQKIYLRRPHKKSHLGCKNCKQRRIKCDEHLPLCSQCKRANADCSYLSYTPQQISEHKEKQRLAAAAAIAAASSNTANSTNSSSSSSTSSTKSLHPSSNTRTQNFTLPSQYLFSQGPPAPKGLYSATAATSIKSATITTTSKTTGISKKASSAIAILSPEATLVSPPPGLSPPIGPPLGANGVTQLTPPSTDKYCKYYLPPINGHCPIPKTPVSLPALNKKLSLPALGDSQTRVAGQVERRPLSSILKLTRHGSASTDSISNTYGDWMSTTLALAYHHTCLYHAVMAFSYGFLYFKTGNSEFGSSSDKHRFIALHEIQQEIVKLSSANADALLGTSLILSWDMFLQESRFESYISMSRGLGAVLEKIQALSPTTQSTVFMTESLFHAMKSILFPAYDRTFFNETIQQIESLASFFQESTDSTLIEEYNFLSSFMVKAMSLLENSPIIYATSSSGKTKSRIHDPHSLYMLMKDWLINFPSSALTPDTQQSGYAQVLYAYFYAVTLALDSLLPEVRYLFQFSFLGPIDLMDPSDNTYLSTDPVILHKLKYPVRLISFFKKRQHELSKIFMPTIDTFTPRSSREDSVGSAASSSSSYVSFSRPAALEPTITELFVSSFLVPDFNMNNHMPYTISSPSTIISTTTPVMSSPLISLHDEPLSPLSVGSSPDASYNCTFSGSSSSSSNYNNNNGTNLCNPGNTGGAPQMSFGMYKSYFTDRMDILQQFSGSSRKNSTTSK